LVCRSDGQDRHEEQHTDPHPKKKTPIPSMIISPTPGLQHGFSWHGAIRTIAGLLGIHSRFIRHPPNAKKKGFEQKGKIRPFACGVYFFPPRHLF